jgi:hypothetical protein
MMKAHVIENGKVTNTIEVDSLDFMPNLVEATEGGIGWDYVDGRLIPPPQTPISEEILANMARAKRDKLLAASDWTQVADAPVDQAAWATYRQALRDIPSQPGFPAEIIWPVKPE